VKIENVFSPNMPYLFLNELMKEKDNIAQPMWLEDLSTLLKLLNKNTINLYCTMSADSILCGVTQ
jgi:hypothetical protein